MNARKRIEARAAAQARSRYTPPYYATDEGFAALQTRAADTQREPIDQQQPYHPRQKHQTDLSLSAHLTGLASEQGFRITRCASCGGPRVHSKRHDDLSHCLRCEPAHQLVSDQPSTLDQHNGRLTEAQLLADAPDEQPRLKKAKRHVSWRRCALCKKQNMTGRSLDATFCENCAKLKSHERVRYRRRYGVDQAAS